MHNPVEESARFSFNPSPYTKNFFRNRASDLAATSGYPYPFPHRFFILQTPPYPRANSRAPTHGEPVRIPLRCRAVYRTQKTSAHKEGTDPQSIVVVPFGHAEFCASDVVRLFGQRVRFFWAQTPRWGVLRRARRGIYSEGLAPPSGGQFGVSPPPFDLEFSFFQQEKKKIKKEGEAPLPSLLSKGSCLAFHGLACALSSDPPVCPRSGAGAGAGGRVPGLPLACAIPSVDPGQPEPLPIIRAYRASCAHPHRCPAQRPAGRRKADRQRAIESIPAHLGALTRPHRPHSSIAKGTR